VFVTRAGGTYSRSRTTTRGLPQGSCISPLLFVLVILNSLLQVVAPLANVAAFADDVAIWLVGPDARTIQRALQQVTDVVENWLANRGMGLSPGKSQLVVFARGGTQTAELRIAGQTVVSVNQVRYLGVVMDARLSWQAEGDILCGMVRDSSRLLPVLMGNKLLCKRRVLLTVYKAFIQARIDFHLPFLCGVREILRKVQVEVNKCLRMITGCLWTTAVPALHVEAGIQPQFWRARDLLLRLVVRGIGRGPQDLVGAILLDYASLSSALLQGLGVMGTGVSMLRAPELRGFQASPVEELVCPWVWKPLLAGSVDVGLSDTQPHLNIFCDASFNVRSWSGGVGVAVPDWKLAYAWQVRSVPSIFIAELLAISVAVDIGMDLGVCSFSVFSDSLAAVRFLSMGFSQMATAEPILLEVGAKLSAACRAGVLVQIGWVKGHSGVTGNELADELARAGAHDGRNLLVAQYSARDLRPVVASVIGAGWEREWLQETKGRDLFVIHPSVSRPRELDHFSVRDAAVISRLRTGHVLLPGHACALGLANAPRCPCGLAWGSVDHFLADCPLYVTARAVMRNVVGGDLSLPILLGVRPHATDGVVKRLRAVVRFCRRVGLGSRLF